MRKSLLPRIDPLAIYSLFGRCAVLVSAGLGLAIVRVSSWPLGLGICKQRRNAVDSPAPLEPAAQPAVRPGRLPRQSVGHWPGAAQLPVPGTRTAS